MLNQQSASAVMAVSPPPTEGLTSLEAAKRLQDYGPNTVAESRSRGVATLLRKFWGVIPWMLELAILVDLVLGRWIEAIIIAALLVFQALLGFYQEGRARHALALLRQHLTINARVRRDGQWQVLPAAALVPGDLVHLRAGDVVPADVQLTEGELSVDQSQLTGESLPVAAGRGQPAYAGSMVGRGEASGIVAATGDRTYYGKTASLVRTAEAPRRLELLTVAIARYLVALDVFLVVAVVAAIVLRGTALLDALPFILLLLVASVPIAMPAMFAMSGALGARGLAEKGILATRPSAIQDAAVMDVVCLDKTGTITENRLTVGTLQAVGATTQDELLRLAALASEEATQDPLDLAVLEAARTRGLLANPPPRLGFVPFDPSTKRSEVTIRQGDQVVRIVKGEPGTIAELAHVPWSEVADDVELLSADGSRVLAIASGPDGNLALAGFIALSDPPRADSAVLVGHLKDQGVQVLLVTGDGEATARAIASSVGITGEVAPAGTLHENLDPDVAARYSVFARVLPQDKFFLVQALQKAGHVVGMTGDGVNDAPALRQADVGIAVASATDVAKAAASLILTRPGLGEILMAIDGSRRIYQRMETWVLAMVTRKMGIPPFLALGVLLFGVFALNPTAMILFMLTGDIATFALAGDQVIPARTPDHWIVRRLVAVGLGLATLLLLASAGVYWVAANVLHLDLAQTQTVDFLWLSFAAAQAVLYSARARGPFWKKPYPGRWLLLATAFDLIVVSLLATLGWLMAPISLTLVAELLVLTVLFLVATDGLKALLNRLAPTPAHPAPALPREGVSR